MVEYRIARRVLMAEVSGGRERGRPRLGWMDGVKPWATEEWLWRLRFNAQKIRKNGEPWCICNCMNFTRPFFERHFGLSDRPLVLWWLSPGEGWDAVA